MSGLPTHGRRRARPVSLGVAVVLVVALLVGPSSGPAATVQEAAPAPRAAGVPDIGAPGSTAQIRFVTSTVVDGWRYDQYRNPAYPCAVQGDNTFTIATRLGTPSDTVRPLWVYLHGGGFGHFDPSGTPQPNTTHMVEETPARQVRFLGQGANGGAGLLHDVPEAPAGFRMLGVSMCGHDGYGGPDGPDPNNPNTTADGRPRTVNGLYATKAAIAFTLRTVATDDFVLHGASAGSVGAWHVAWGLDAQGVVPAAVIADSGILGSAREGWLDEDPGCGSNSEGSQIFRRRLHPALLEPGNEPGDLVADGRISSPVLDVWVGNDPVWCGDTPVRCPVDDGPPINLGANDCMHEGVRRAIAGQAPLGRSRSMELCVDDPRIVGPCDRHIPTVVDDVPNTAGPWPEDYLGSIMAWVTARLRDPEPAPGAARTPGLSFTTAAVVDLLGRSDPRRAEASALALAAGASKSTVFGRLTRSTEWLSAIVQSLYRRTLGRTGSTADLAFWVGELASGRRTVAQVSASFYASAEYYRNVGETVRAWVTDLYDAILGRAPDPGGVAFWSGEVARTGRTSVAFRFFQSAESAGDRVAALYRSLLGRDPSATDVDYWGRRVRSEGDLALAVSLAASAEYQARARTRYP